MGEYVEYESVTRWVVDVVAKGAWALDLVRSM